MQEKHVEVFAKSLFKNYVIRSLEIKKNGYWLIGAVDICKLYTAV